MEKSDIFTEKQITDYVQKCRNIAAKFKIKIMKNIVLLLMLALLIVGCGESQQVQKQKPPIRVVTETASGANTALQRTYSGIVEENEAVSVSFTGMGVVKKVLVSEGQKVAKGQLIAEMDDTQARNMLDVAKAALSQADDAIKRYKMLYDNGSLPEVQWVEIQSKHSQAKSQLEAAQKNLADCRLIAPESGIIGKKLVGAGETALPAQAVVTILDINSVKVKVSVPEKEISDINDGTKTDIKVEAANINLNGGKIEKGIVADALTHTYDVRINVKNQNQKLLPGMAAQVSFDFGGGQATAQKCITLPVTAVQKRFDGTFFVWTIDSDNAAHRTQVTTGALSGNRIEILSGLHGGEKVVIEGWQKLSENTITTTENTGKK